MTTAQLTVERLKRGRVIARLIGDTPLYYNAMTAKAKRTLLVGGQRKTNAEKALIKHDPEAEFRSSVYRAEAGPTLLCFPAPAIKQAMATAALMTPGMKKTEVQRAVFVPTYHFSIYGRPLMKMDVVRQAGVANTPDIRTRAYLPRWAAEVEIRFITPALSEYAIFSLLTNAGLVSGIGDFRQEKGKGGYGTFSVFEEDLSGDDEAAERWDLITAEARDVQADALEHPEPADAETRDLLAEIASERTRRAG